ncbi:MAG TPA: hypothetical protein DCE41_24410 [Cytophagales bacterium]|nr:hypothetical protein [Cytophagales bacterium]HAA18258.1 hypothetical protein [Cytophagales bacterium]HAP64933.1 hypothetical protein [Cytophagales bacterium]
MKIAHLVISFVPYRMAESQEAKKLALIQWLSGLSDPEIIDELMDKMEEVKATTTPKVVKPDIRNSYEWYK